MKNIKDLSNILNINNQKKEFNFLIENICIILNKETGLDLENDNIFLKDNILKIKTNSNKKFVLFLNLNRINESLKSLDNKIILEL